MKIYQRWKQTAIHNKALVLTGTIVAFGTLFYVGVAIFQYCLMEKSANLASKQTDRMIGEMEKQTQAMQNAANTSKNAVKLAERNIQTTQEQSRLDQRAWVGATEMNPPSFKDGDITVYIKEGEKNTSFGVNIVNSGKTPARKVKNKQKITAYPANAKFIPFYPPINEREMSVSVIQPGMKSILYFGLFDDPLTKEQINSFREGENILYIYGEITYEDVFGKKHRTTFCSYLDKTLSKTFQCQTYNYTD